MKCVENNVKLQNNLWITSIITNTKRILRKNFARNATKTFYASHISFYWNRDQNLSRLFIFQFISSVMSLSYFFILKVSSSLLNHVFFYHCFILFRFSIWINCFLAVYCIKKMGIDASFMYIISHVSIYYEYNSIHIKFKVISKFHSVIYCRKTIFNSLPRLHSLLMELRYEYPEVNVLSIHIS